MLTWYCHPWRPSGRILFDKSSGRSKIRPLAAPGALPPGFTARNPWNLTLQPFCILTKHCETTPTNDLEHSRGMNWTLWNILAAQDGRRFSRFLWKIRHFDVLSRSLKCCWTCSMFGHIGMAKAVTWLPFGFDLENSNHVENSNHCRDIAIHFPRTGCRHILWHFPRWCLQVNIVAEECSNTISNITTVFESMVMYGDYWHIK